MDYKQIINYREKCLICQEDLRFFAPDYPNLQLNLVEEGFKMSFAPRGKKDGIQALFRYDGTFEKNKSNNIIYKKPIDIIRGCSLCESKSEDDISLLAPFGSMILGTKARKSSTSFMGDKYTSLNNIKANDCSYNFSLSIGTSGRYMAALKYEVVRYHNNAAYYHIDNSHVSGTTILNHGKFESTIDSVMTLKIPTLVNLSNVKNIDQYMNKYRTYLLMS